MSSNSISVSAQADLAERLRQAMEAARGRDSRALMILKAAVNDFAREMASSGVPPEKVLVTLKGVISSRVTPLVTPIQGDWNGDRLHETITSWCIDAYFRESTPGTGIQEGTVEAS